MSTRMQFFRRQTPRRVALTTAAVVAIVTALAVVTGGSDDEPAQAQVPDDPGISIPEPDALPTPIPSESTTTSTPTTVPASTGAATTPRTGSSQNPATTTSLPRIRTDGPRPGPSQTPSPTAAATTFDIGDVNRVTLEPEYQAVNLDQGLVATLIDKARAERRPWSDVVAERLGNVRSLPEEHRLRTLGLNDNIAAYMRYCTFNQLTWAACAQTVAGAPQYLQSTDTFNRINPSYRAVNLDDNQKRAVLTCIEPRILDGDQYHWSTCAATVVNVVTVPDVRGQREIDASYLLRMEGLNIQWKIVINPFADPDTRVSDQSPEPGSVVPDGTTIKVTIERTT